MGTSLKCLLNCIPGSGASAPRPRRSASARRPRAPAARRPAGSSPDQPRRPAAPSPSPRKPCRKNDSKIKIHVFATFLDYFSSDIFAASVHKCLLKESPLLAKVKMHFCTYQVFFYVPCLLPNRRCEADLMLNPSYCSPNESLYPFY